MPWRITTVLDLEICHRFAGPKKKSDSFRSPTNFTYLLVTFWNSSCRVWGYTTVDGRHPAPVDSLSPLFTRVWYISGGDWNISPQQYYIDCYYGDQKKNQQYYWTKPLKIDGWKMIHFLLGLAVFFRGRLVSGRVHITYQSPCLWHPSRQRCLSTSQPIRRETKSLVHWPTACVAKVRPKWDTPPFLDEGRFGTTKTEKKLSCLLRL